MNEHKEISQSFKQNRSSSSKQIVPLRKREKLPGCFMECTAAQSSFRTKRSMQRR